jgi:peptidoglycan/xylan/chitin deacetylase (PgdA/CDA1 family)
MRAITLLYHDVVTAGHFGSSGFSGADADIYKLSREAFIEHLDAIKAALPHPPVTVQEALLPETKSAVLLAFDDGGAGTWEHTAPLLEERGWRGHFFIPTNWIGKPGFLTANQILLLHQRGHVIGSHSCSHPLRMSSLPRKEIFREWQLSIQQLSEIVGEPLFTASVPAGYYSPAVAEAAEAAGIRALFHSEPVATVKRFQTCQLFGRYSIQRATAPHTAAAIARGSWNPRTRQFLFWEFKKILKRGGGEAWLKFRKRWLAKSA